MNKTLIISGLAVVTVVVFFATRNTTPKTHYYPVNTAAAQNVSTADGKQIIEIAAKGGYAPRQTTAKAGIASVIRVKTNATFDCSSSLRIPKLGYAGNLPPTGTTDIEVPAQAAGTKLDALCSMGMYTFSISFQG